MIDYCKNNLQSIKQLMALINHNQYTYKSVLLSGSTIGQHIRHVLEFYLCLINGAKLGNVNYDKRNRDLNIENDMAFAIYSIDKICSNLKVSDSNTAITLEGNFSTNPQNNITIKTTFKRELAYCLEHTIHHQALIKIALKEQLLDNIIQENFGVAPATIRNNNLIYK